ncbi:MAG: TIGR00730 family Rossman fold protein [Alphaproteobacteria bacterium]|nr:TIGR00730 family Rossman fold protein [Alphaproteobacteria bacterium]
MAGKLKSVAVYCGHQFGCDAAYARDAAQIGEMLAKSGIRIVFGGGNVGLMGTVANAALNAGGHVTGITTHDVVAKQEPMHDNLNQFEIVNGVNERKQKMFELSDGFIILPGGTGTLNELTDIMTMQQIGETNKPLFFMNTKNFWAPFARLLIHMQDCGFFVRPEDYNMHTAQTPDELIQKVLNY